MSDPEALRADLMRAPIDDLTIEELRERYRRTWNYWIAELQEEKKAAYDYWAKVRAEEADALQRVRIALIGHGIHKKNIPVAVIERALVDAGGEP